jgi:hypothetical protein
MKRAKFANAHSVLRSAAKRLIAQPLLLQWEGFARQALIGLNPESPLEQPTPVALKEGRRPSMLRVKSSRPIRTTLNLADTKQVKSVRRRLGISDADLVRIVNKIGNALAAISKEVELERLSALEKSISKKEPAALA